MAPLNSACSHPTFGLHSSGSTSYAGMLNCRRLCTGQRVMILYTLHAHAGSVQRNYPRASVLTQGAAPSLPA